MLRIFYSEKEDSAASREKELNLELVIDFKDVLTTVL